MANCGGNIPENCDKMLFAEDVVSFIMLQTLQEHYCASVAAPYREFIYPAFTSNIRKAVHAITRRITTLNATNRHKHSTQTSPNKFFRKFSERLRKKFFHDGFDPKFFLYYCVHLSLEASRLASIIGLQKAGNLAVKYILEGFCSYDMFSGGWQVLDMLAKKRYADSIHFIDNTPDADIILSEAEDSSSSSEDDLVFENLLQNIEENHTVDVEDLCKKPLLNSNENYDVILKNTDKFDANVKPLNLDHNKDTGSQNFQTTTSSTETSISTDKREEITSLNTDGAVSRRILSEKSENVLSNYCPASSSRDNISLDLVNYSSLPESEENAEPNENRLLARNYKELEIAESLIQNPSSIESNPTNSESCPVMADKTSSAELQKRSSSSSLETDPIIPKKQKVLSYSENSSN